MFAALDDPQRARLYYLLAAVYAVPSLRNGFTLDSFSIACLLLGIAHVQARGAFDNPSVPWHVRLCIRAGAYAGPHPWMGSCAHFLVALRLCRCM